MTWRFVGANFDQMHMHTNLGWVVDEPNAELVGVCDEDPSTSTGSLERTAKEYGISREQRYGDLDRCIEESDPDFVIGCPMNSLHADFVERVAQYDVHVAIEKPFAMSLDDADRMIDVMASSAGRFAINWPASWLAKNYEVKRLLDQGTIGEVFEIQYYGGNRGAAPDDSWFYKAECGGGSMLDYLGYGATFSTWFRGGKLPESVTAETYVPENLEVDTQSASVCRFPDGITTIQTTWRMLTNPWEVQPQPAKGYEIVGTKGSISTRDRNVLIRVATEDEPEGYTIDHEPVEPPNENLVQYLLHCIENDEPITGPTSPEFCREAQRIIETARRSAESGGRTPLVD